MYRPDLVRISDEAYLEAVRAMWAAGAYPGTTLEQAYAFAPSPFRWRCALPDFFQAAETCMWPMKDVSYAHRLQLPGLTQAQIETAFDEACWEWNKVCGIRLKITQDFEKANIYANSGKIDGAGRTLAWSYLPCGATPDSRMEQLYDNSEMWSYAFAKGVIGHEVGHAIGLPHGPKGSLMQPYADSLIVTPQEWDRAETRKRYGPPEEQPELPPGDMEISGVIVINKRVFNLEVKPA